MTTLKESHLIGPTHIPLQDTTYPKHFLEIVRQYPDKECFAFRSGTTGQNTRHTYTQLLDILNRIIYAFDTVIKVPKHTVVAIYLPNALEYVYSQMAALCGGFIMMPLNPLYTKPQLDRLLPRVNPSVIVTMSPMLPKLPEGYNVCLIDKTATSDPDRHIYAMHEFLSVASPVNCVEEAVKILKPTDDSFYGCTSGSTGEPKICVYTHYSMINPFITFDHSKNTPLDKRVALSYTPLFTTAAHFQIDAIFAVGAKVIVVDKFEPATILRFIEEEQATNVNSAPSGILALINHPSFTKEKVKSVLHVTMGGAVVSDALMNEAKEKMGLISCKSGYGMTELCGVMYNMDVVEGAVSAHYQLRIVDHVTRKITPVGVPGEVEIKTPIMMRGYLNNENANKESYTEDGWFKTGDEGCLDKHGRMIITGRVKDMIIRGGHNVFPSEIVDTLQSHKDVVLAGCVSVPDRAQGELIVAFVTIKERVNAIDGSANGNCTGNDSGKMNENANGNDEIVKELKEYCRKRLVSFAVPTHIFVLEKMPMNSFGKVYSPALRQEAVKKIKEYWDEKCAKNTNKPETEGGKAIAALWAQWFGIPEDAISKEMNFFDVGGDSLVGTQTVGLIRKYVKEAPFDLLTKCPTLGMLEQYLLNPQLEMIHPQFKKDIEEIQQLKCEHIEIDMKKVEEKKTVLITGSNGFLGIHLVQAFQKKGYHVLCLVRSTTISDGWKRITQAANSSEIELEMDKMEVVLGDVSLLKCGMKEDVYQAIIKRIGLIVHNAAYVNWNRSYVDMRDSNYIGTQNMIEFVRDSKVPFLYVSSIGVASTVGGKEVIPNPEIIPYKANGYIQTKWMNELYLNKLREFGYQIGILRPAFISGNSISGCSNTDDFVWKFIRLLINNSLSPIENKMILTPVNLVANAFVESITKLPITCNLLPVQRADIADICSILAKKMNVIIEKKSMEEIKMKLAELAQCGNKEVMTLLPSLQMTANVPFEMNWVVENNIELSETNESLEHSVDYLLRVGFFGEQFADGKSKGIGRAGH